MFLYMKRTPPAKPRAALAPRGIAPEACPYGPGVFTRPDGEGRRIEIGRIVPEAGGWRALRLVDGAYVELGRADSALETMMLLPDPMEEVPAVAKAGAGRVRTQAMAAANPSPSRQAKAPLPPVRKAAGRR